METLNLCNVIGLGGARRPILIPRKLEDLPETLKSLKPAQLPQDEGEAIRQIEEQYLKFTRRYAEIAGIDKKAYYRQFSDNFLPEHWDKHPLLTEEHCETLALGKFLWDQIDKIEGLDYSGPGLHFSGVFESFISRTVFYNCAGLSEFRSRNKNQTLGTLPFMQKAFYQSNFKQALDVHDWEVLSGHIQKNWNPFVTEDGSIQFAFKDYIDQMWLVSDLRNRAAHPGHFTRQELLELWQMLFIKTKKSMVGMIPALLNGWKTR